MNMHRLILAYLLALFAVATTAVVAFVVSIRPVDLAVVCSLPFFFVALLVALNVEPARSFESRAGLDGLLALKRDGALLRHAAHVRPSRSRTGTPPLGRPSPADTTLDRLTRLKDGWPPDPRYRGVRRRA
jgi:hypothetical protein